MPLKHGDGAAIQNEKIRRVREEVFAAFGCWAVHYGRARRYDRVEYVEIVKMEFITSSDRVAKKSLENVKEHLKESLQQIDILIASHTIQII